MLPMIKLLLNISQSDVSSDAVLTYLININKSKILAYCNLTALPEALESVVVEIVAAQYKGQYASQPYLAAQQTSPSTQQIKSETIGDYKVEYAASSSSSSSISASTSISILDDYKSILNQFRKVKFI